MFFGEASDMHMGLPNDIFFAIIGAEHTENLWKTYRKPIEEVEGNLL